MNPWPMRLLKEAEMRKLRKAYLDNIEELERRRLYHEANPV
jgi:hypothetical protein